MKVIALLLTVLLSAHGLVAASRFDDCVSHCRTKVLEASEKECGPMRTELPRPDLYNHCGDGYNEGATVSCDEHCLTDADERRLDSRRLDACSKLRGYPPAERMAACNEGFVKARTRARLLVEARRLQEAKEDAAGESEPKRKLSIKSQTTNSAKNVLEAAREEAAAAFQEAKSADL